MELVQCKVSAKINFPDEIFIGKLHINKQVGAVKWKTLTMRKHN